MDRALAVADGQVGRAVIDGGFYLDKPVVSGDDAVRGCFRDVDFNRGGNGANSDREIVDCS